MVSNAADQSSMSKTAQQLLSDIKLRFGVPQGSVLGPKLYFIFAKPVGEICRRHGMSYHSYANDTQVYQVIKPQGDWSDLLLLVPYNNALR
jgi:hypothetical protein